MKLNDFPKKTYTIAAKNATFNTKTDQLLLMTISVENQNYYLFRLNRFLGECSFMSSKYHLQLSE